MAYLKLTFDNPINVSAQPGDMVYCISTTGIGTALDTFEVNDLSSGKEIGNVVQINNGDGLDTANPIEILINETIAGVVINEGDFIMFSKNKEANTSGLLGYYASIKMINDSTGSIELFSVGSQITQSST